MTARQALVIACLVVFPGVMLRAVPHLDRLVKSRQAVTTSPSVPSAVAEARLPARLSERPTRALALGLVIEVALHVVLLVALLRCRLFGSLWPALPTSLRTAATLLFTLMITGFLGGTAATFPFVAWRMYSGEYDGEPTVFRLTGTTRSGVARAVDVERVIPVLGAHRLHQMLAFQARWVEEPRGDVERRSRQDLQRRTLAGLGHVCSVRNPDDPLRQLSLHVENIPLDAASPPWRRDQRLIQTVDIEP